MTNKELLTLAAKAVGLGVRWVDVRIIGDAVFPLPEHEQYCVRTDTGERWEPLHDDGDALRLAVKLRMDVQFETGSVSITNVVIYDEYGFEEDCAYLLAEDPNAATRRAIVRAAAEIGRTVA